jgi:hypothetical protein
MCVGGWGVGGNQREGAEDGTWKAPAFSHTTQSNSVILFISVLVVF